MLWVLGGVPLAEVQPFPQEKMQVFLTVPGGRHGLTSV